MAHAIPGWSFEAFKAQVDTQSVAKLTDPAEKVLNLWLRDEFLGTLKKPAGRNLAEDYLAALTGMVDGSKASIRKGRKVFPYLRDECGYERAPSRMHSRDPADHWWVGSEPPALEFFEDKPPRPSTALKSAPGSGPVVATPGPAVVHAHSPGLKAK